MTGRERVLALLDGRQADRLPLMPITMMLAAAGIGVPYGRYALRHEVLTEAQLRVAERFGFDHVSAITETREARDCGAALCFFEDQPYAIDETNARLRDKRHLAELSMPDPWSAEAMSDRLAAIRTLRARAGGERIVEGWVEGPSTAAADLRGINTLMLDFHDDPGFVEELFDFVVELAVRFARAQVEAGADVIGIGDPSASLVGPRIYRSMIWPRQKRLVDGIHDAGGRVRLHICGNTRGFLDAIGALGADIVDIDSAVSLVDARAKMGGRQVLLGGIDPVRVLLQGTPDDVAAAVRRCRAEAGPNYIVGAGCEVPRGTPAANLEALRAGAEGGLS